MQNEKIASIVLAVIIIVALAGFFLIMYGDEIFDNLFGEKTIETGDCADIHYTGKFADGTVFDTSHESVAQEWNIYDETRNYSPLNIFVTTNASQYPPDDYSNYSSSYIEGLLEGLVGLKEGEKTTIGPIPPEKGYGGVYPSVGDSFNVTDPTTGKNIEFIFTNIKENAPMPDYFVEIGYSNTSTTIFELRIVAYEIGDSLSYHLAWINDSIVTEINKTTLTFYTTPPADGLENLTWVNVTTGVTYWVNATDVIDITDSTFTIQHTPEVGDIFTIQADIFTVTTYTVVSLTDTVVNCSYDDGTGNLSYAEFDRVEVFNRTGTLSVLQEYPADAFDYLVYLLQNYDPDISYSSNKAAGKTLYFEVEIVKVYKTSS